MIVEERKGRLDRARQHVLQTLGDRGSYDSSTLSMAETFLGRVERCVALLNKPVEVRKPVAEWVGQVMLTDSFPVLLQHRAGDPEGAADLLMHIWTDHARMRGMDVPGLPQRPSPIANAAGIGTEEVGELQRMYTTAVGQVLVARASQESAGDGLRVLKARLRLSWDELGSMFRVSGETVRRWEQGRHGLKPDQGARLSEAESALSRLTRLFKPERLPDVIRRRAPSFGGESALDWILRGRIAEVADVYEAELAWQG